MQIRILHIDDDHIVRQNFMDIVNEHQIGNDTLVVKDSCSFNDGLEKLRLENYDLVILDLCVGTAAEESEKLGADVLEEIKGYAFVPVVFFTGLPGFVKNMESDVVKIAGKGSGFDELFEKIGEVLETGFIGLKKDVDSIIREGLRSYFWKFVHPNKSVINSIGDDVSLKYLLMRRLAKNFSSELIKDAVNDPLLNRTLAHPMEFYIYPPIEGEYETGDIIQHRKTNEVFVILTPACDFVLRKNGTRKADKILLAQAFDIKQTLEYKKLQEMLEKERKANELKKPLSKEELGQIKSLKGDIKVLMKPGNDRFFFLPGTPFIKASIVDFQYKVSITYTELEENYNVLATLDDPFAQSMQSSFTRYYNRVGYPDLDVEYVYDRL